MNAFKTLFLIIYLIIVVFSSNAQNKYNTPVEKVKGKIILFFNNKQADSLYDLTGADFRKAISEKKFADISQNQLFHLGKINKAEFDTIINGVAKYKTSFDRGVFGMFISLDSLNKLKTFLIKPYKEDVKGPITHTKNDNSMKTVLDRKIDSIFQKFLFKSKIVGLSAGIMKNGEFFYYNYGEVKKGGHQLPDSLSIYEIGSITKTFTGLLLAKAVFDKKIKLSDPVNKYLPDNIPLLKYNNDTIKILDLANHTSGLPRLPLNMLFSDINNPYKNYTNAKLFSFLKQVKIQHKPGTVYEYSNLGVGLLGVILEGVCKMSYEKMIKQFICSKAGMKYTTQSMDERSKAFFVQGYNQELEPHSQWDFKALSGAGCIRSNTHDMLLYAKMQSAINLNERYLMSILELSHKSTFTNGSQTIALNWFIQNWGNGNVLFHSGQTGGYASFLAVHPETKNAVVILSNTAISNDEEGVRLLQLLDENE